MAGHDFTGSVVETRERGLTIARPVNRLEIELRPVGAGRFFGAGFLGVWLAGWAIGEAFALWLLIRGGWQFLHGTLPAAGDDQAPLTVGAALGVAAFLVVWTSFWTLGGVLAGREFLRTLWGRDRLVATSQGLEVIHRAGPFRRAKLYRREDLRRLYLIKSGSALMLECDKGGVELTTFGTTEQKDRILATLAAALRLAPPEGGRVELPADWEAERALEGGTLLLRSRAIRRTRVRVAWGFALVALTVAALLVYSAARDPAIVVPAIVVGALALAAAWLAWWTSSVRSEWRIEPGRVVQQRRVGRAARVQFVGREIALSEHSDSDGDRWYKVEIVGETAATGAASQPKSPRRTIHSQLHDPTEPRRIAAWVAAESGLPVTNAIKTSEQTAAENTEALRQLAASGRFGRWMAGALARRVAKDKS